MSVTTSQRINRDQLAAQFTGPQAFSVIGAPLESTGSKTITADGVDDATLTQKVSAAAAVFVDRDANTAALQAKAVAAIQTNKTFLALASPTAAQVRDQTIALSREMNGIIKLLVGQVDDTSGTLP